MFNNSTSPLSAGHDSSNRSSRTSNGTPSSMLAPELETALREGLIADGRNQGRGQSRDTYGNPIPLPPMYANFWNGANWFPGHSAGIAAGNPSGGDGYPLASAAYHGQPMPPNFQSGQTGESGGMFYSGFPATTSPLPGGNTTHPPRPTPSVYPTPDARGEPAAVWHSYCWINRAERDEVHMTIVLKRSPPA
ncbi:hypothetical protein EDB92DRAFT_1053195 [Lactarius akahatsu]|uniref:Uncharacterized protein n=1 Tax=Lactarius akahatsu TaxID=416441 RepID=A0AAD4Q6H3_9AGAM|nr:hypothetical protein EDB92DRAFT_1053195 [Lactarius akahatsu]